MVARMPHADFVHLRVHSAYSLSEGAIKADKIAALAKEAAMPAVAITDTANLFGALEFSQACVGQGRAADHRLPDRARADRHAARATRCGRRPIRSCCWRRTRRGWPICSASPRWLSRHRARSSSRRSRSKRLAAHAAGLILLTGGTRGPVARLLAGGAQERGGSAGRAIRRGIPRSRDDGTASPRSRARTRDRARPDRDRRRRAAAAGRHQRVLLPEARAVRGA